MRTSAAGQTGPRISIITPTLNRGHLIEKAIQSVAAQHYANVEHIIVDGASTDDTLERLSRYPNLRVVSEPDRGLYDAYNKGVRLASGDVIGFLNDDDYYEEGVLGDVAEAFRAPVEPQVVCGPFSEVSMTTAGAYEHEKEVQERPSVRLTLNTLNLDPNETGLNARFFDKSIFEEVGGFDIRYPVGADWDFMIRVAIRAPRVAYVPRVVYRYRVHENQVSFGHGPETTQAGLQERLTILERLVATSSLDSSGRRALRQLHSSMTLTAMGVALGSFHRRWDLAAGYALRGLRHDPLFAWRLGSRLIGRLRPAPPEAGRN